MPDINFEVSNVIYGKFFPALKPIHAAVRKAGKVTKSEFYHYEPGNGTRYEVAFITYDYGFGLETVMTVANMSKSMVIPSYMLTNSQIGYMQEKLDLGEGDCYALMPLINHYLEELGE